MISRILNGLLILLAVGLVVHFVYTLPKFDEGEQAPNFEINLLTGEAFTLKELAGKYVLLDFWGSWCESCRKENRSLVDLYQKHKDNQYETAEGFSIVSVGIEENETQWNNAIVQDRLNWDYHIGQFEKFDSPIAKLYGVKQIPTKYLISPEGVILGVNQSIDEIDKYLIDQLKN